MELYKWQKECLAAWVDNKYRGIINVVTGAGKTVAAMAAIDMLLSSKPGLKIKIVVPTIPLANQWKQALISHAFQEDMIPGFFGGGRHDDPDCKIMIYIVNSARETLSKHIKASFALDQPVFLICDECHHYQSRENRRIFDFLEESKIAGVSLDSLYFCMGLSATPFGIGDDAFLKKVLGKEVFSFGFNQGSSEKILSDFYVCHISVSFTADELQNYSSLSYTINVLMKKLQTIYPRLKGLGKSAFMKEIMAIAKGCNMDPGEPAVKFLFALYRRKEISVLADSRVRCCLRLISSLSGKSRIIVFCERISQAEELYRLISRKYGAICSIYHSNMTAQSRKRVLAGYRDKDFRILITCKCLDEGIDVPDADTGIVMSSSEVSRQRIQRLGRLLRKSPGKTTACLYYLYVRESSDDSFYLRNLPENKLFNLQYYNDEDFFSNDIYEYGANRLLTSVSSRCSDKAALKELRRCIIEGLIRPDYLESHEIIDAKLRSTDNPHEKNYWRTMKKLSFNADSSHK